MKYLFLIFVLVLCSPVSAQSLSYELDKIREIKMLESTRDDVRRVLSGYQSDDEFDEFDWETFSSEKMDVEVKYTSGDCSDDSDDTDEWKAAKGKVKLIEISFDDPVKSEDLRLKDSDFQKEQRFANNEEDFVYHDKDKGISFFVNEEGIKSINLFPVKSRKSSLCKNEESEKLQEFYSTESYFGNIKLEDRSAEIACFVPSVSELTLSANEINASCSAVDPAKHKNCSNSPLIISVSTTANDPENDVPVYVYKVSGGRIVGEGKDVIWDLAGVKPGEYTITAGVDDGCGICGETKTQSVVVK